MSEPTHNSPLGTPNNSPHIDSGTMARTRHAAPGVVGYSFSLLRNADSLGVLAMFDMENAVIWVNGALLSQLGRTHKKGGFLATKDIVTLVHEFSHVLQYEDIFKKYSTRQERASAMIKRRAEKVMNLTEDEYVKYVLKLEANAEFKAQLIDMELLNAFAKSRGHGEFSREDRRQFSREKALAWIKSGRKGYSQKARNSYQKIRKAATDHGGAKGVAEASARKEKETYTMIQVSKIKAALPTQDSPKLKILVDKMVRFDIAIVVGLKEGKN